MDVWDRTFAINTRGTLLCYKYAAIQMIKQGRGGRIVGASSAAGKQGELVAYGDFPAANSSDGRLGND